MTNNARGIVLLEPFGLDVASHNGQAVALLVPTVQRSDAEAGHGCMVEVPIGSGEATQLAALLRGLTWDCPPMYEVLDTLLTQLDARLVRVHLEPTGTRRWRANLHIVGADGQSMLQRARASDGLLLATYRSVDISVDAQALAERALGADRSSTGVPQPRLARGSMPHVQIPTSVPVAATDAEPHDQLLDMPAATPAQPAGERNVSASSPRIPLPRCSTAPSPTAGSIRSERDSCTRATSRRSGK